MALRPPVTAREDEPPLQGLGNRNVHDLVPSFALADDGRPPPVKADDVNLLLTPQDGVDPPPAAAERVEPLPQHSIRVPPP